MNLSLVKPETLQKDPRKLPYMYPKMPVIRYKELSEQYHRTLTLQAAEQIGAMFGAVLVPSSCINHKRRRADRRMMIYGRTYYVLERDELTDVEWAKYTAVTAE